MIQLRSSWSHICKPFRPRADLLALFGNSNKSRDRIEVLTGIRALALL